MLPTVSDCRIIQLPKIVDPRGNLTFIEPNSHIPFAIKRVFWIYDVPGGEIRGGHAKRRLEEFVVALSGSFDVALDDGTNKITYTLNRSFYGLYITNMIWRQMTNFSTNAVALGIVSLPFDPGDYIYQYDQFIDIRQRG